MRWTAATLLHLLAAKLPLATACAFLLHHCTGCSYASLLEGMMQGFMQPCMCRRFLSALTWLTASLDCGNTQLLSCEVLDA